jgi:gamma-glutamyl phosphate reductase
MKTDGKISVLKQAELAKKAAAALAAMPGEKRTQALNAMAQVIDDSRQQILEANKKDLVEGEKLVIEKKISQSMFDRLKLDEAKLNAIVSGIKQVASIPDPLGGVTLARELDDGLVLERVACPIGVIGVIFESRPDALPQIASLAVRSANAVLLKGGKEAEATLAALYKCLVEALEKEGFPSHTVTLLNSREDVAALLAADQFVDLIVPRGSNELVRHIQDNTRIPVLGHADGVCHLYVDASADPSKALPLLIDGKTQYPSACNSIETVLVHADVAREFLPAAVKELTESGVEVRGDESSFKYLSKDSETSGELLKSASEADWSAEYCDLIVAVKVVNSVAEAIEHINKYGSRHTDCIVTEDKEVFEQFFAAVDSAGVYWNASTRFADGFRYGFGAEVGISTGKLHPRGPVGVDGLVTYKYKLVGDGHIVADYSSGKKKFKHRDL